MLALVGSPSCILRSLLVCCCLRRYSSVNIPVGFVHYMVNASKLSVWTPPLSPHASPIPPPLFCNDSLEILWFPVVHFLSYPAYKQIEKRGGWCWDRSGGRGGGTEEAVVVVVVVVLAAAAGWIGTALRAPAHQGRLPFPTCAVKWISSSEINRSPGGEREQQGVCGVGYGGGEKKRQGIIRNPLPICGKWSLHLPWIHHWSLKLKSTSVIHGNGPSTPA